MVFAIDNSIRMGHHGLDLVEDILDKLNLRHDKIVILTWDKKLKAVFDRTFNSLVPRKQLMYFHILPIYTRDP